MTTIQQITGRTDLPFTCMTGDRRGWYNPGSTAEITGWDMSALVVGQAETAPAEMSVYSWHPLMLGGELVGHLAEDATGWVVYDLPTAD